MANKLILKRSSVAAKVPLSTDLEVGELAVNLADAKLYTKNSGGTVIELTGGGGGGASVTVSTTAPVSPSAGDLWWDSEEGKLKIYYTDANSSQWVDASAAGANGLDGEGVPAGGSAGQILAKVSSSDYDTQWVDPAESSVGPQTIWVPAGAMIARTTNGAASGTVETTTNDVMLSTLDFDAATAEYAQFNVRMPKGWNESTVTAYFVWSNASGTGNVVWGLQGLGLSNDDVLDSAFGTAQEVTDGVTAAGDLMQSDATAAITIVGTPAEADWVVFQAYRNAATGSDTLGVDARLHGVALIYTTDTANDA
jgi:hypothetical protein